VLTIDVMDVSGSHQEDVAHTVHKKRLDAQGQTIGVPLKEGMFFQNSELVVSFLQRC
jgi:hypothetical protein